MGGLGSLPKVHPETVGDVGSASRQNDTINGTDYKKRYSLLTAAQDLMTRDDHRVCMCCKSPNPMSTEPITVNAESQSGGRASWGGLIKCGNVWACPVCAAKISEERRVEMRQALDGAAARGWGVGMLTLTIQHNKSQSAYTVLVKLRQALRRFVSARRWRDWKAEHNVQGSIRAIEVTYGKNGWHWHAHFLIFTETHIAAEDELTDEMRQHWQRCCEKESAWCDLQHGIDYRYSSDTRGGEYIADYVAKFGKLPETESGSGWDESHEITKASSKVARSAAGRSPFQLLDDYSNGDYQAGALFVEYVRAVKHQRQLVWSNGLKDELLAAAEELLSDEDIAETVEPIVLTEVSDELFSVIVRYRKRGEVLAVAAAGGRSAVVDFLKDFQDRIGFNWNSVDGGSLGRFRYVVQHQESSNLYRVGVWRIGQNVKAPVWRSTKLYNSLSRAIFDGAAACQSLVNDANKDKSK